jgi:hypothetical protein
MNIGQYDIYYGKNVVTQYYCNYEDAAKQFTFEKYYNIIVCERSSEMVFVWKDVTLGFLLFSYKVAM